MTIPITTTSTVHPRLTVHHPPTPQIVQHAPPSPIDDGGCCHAKALPLPAPSPMKRTVLLLTELPRKETEKIVSPYLKDCQHINLFIRSGPLSSTASFKKVAADRARSVILLAPKDD
ncbi:unnamed protein product, partial [Closterium sp. NIES-64]